MDSYMLNEVITNETIYTLQVYYAKPIVSDVNNTLSGVSSSYYWIITKAYIYQIENITEGIKDPFDMDNITSLKVKESFTN